MADFLKKFSNESYKEVEKTNRSEEENNDEKDEQEETIEETIKEIKPIEIKKQSRVEEKAGKTTFQTSNTKEEVYVKDEEKIGKRKKKIIIGIVCAILLVGIGVFTYTKMNEVKVPTFVGEKTLNDVQIWTAKNNIELEYKSVYSVKIDEGCIVNQSVKNGEKVQKGSYFEVVVSKGANPEEHIKVADFMKMNLIEIEKWKKDVKAVNVIIEKVFSEEVESGKVISFEYKSEGIDANNYRRKDKINIVVSKGKEVYEKNIEVPDFKGKAKAEVETWAKEKEVTIEFSEEANSKIMEGMVISQDIGAKSKIAKKDVIRIIVSRGKVAYVPNFAGLDETRGQVEATKANISVNLVYYYSDTVQAGYLISQSLPTGTEVIDQSVSLMYSLGKAYIGNFDGEDVFSMVKSIQEMNGKGAQLTYEVVEVSSTEKKGSIITSNYKAAFVNIGAHIVISVSSGK